MDQETEARLEEELARALTDPLTPQELLEADMILAREDARQRQEHLELQRRRPGSVRTRILAAEQAPTEPVL